MEQFYYVGLRLDSPYKEEAVKLRDEVLKALQLELNGKVYLTKRENPFQNANFSKLIQHLKAGDTLLIHDIVMSTVDLYNMMELVATLYKSNVHLINITMGNINTFDNPLLYQELSELLLLMHNYAIFIYHVCKGSVDEFNWSYVPRVDHIKDTYSEFIEYCLRYELSNYQITKTVTELINKLTNKSFRDYFLKYYPNMESLTLTADINGLNSFLNFVKTV